MKIAVIAPVTGFLLGALDFVWIKFMPAPYADLGNSIAVWAVAAFLFTYFNRWTMARSTLAAVVMVVIAVPSYQVAAALIQNDDWSNPARPSSILWMALGVIAGVVFGIGGVVARTPGKLRLPALSLPSAVMLAELGLHLGRVDDPSYDTGEVVQEVIIRAVLAVALAALVGRTWRDRALALAWAVPLAGAGYLLMIATFFAA